MRIDPTQYRNTFFDEAADHLAALEAALLRFGGERIEPAAVDEAFRAAHTIKSGADAVGLPDVARFTHRLESILDRLRGGGRVPQWVLDLLLESADALSRLLAVARSGDPTPPGMDSVLARLSALADDEKLAPAEYTVRVEPHPDVFRIGLDPLVLIRALTDVGEITAVRMHADNLPLLSDLDPEVCYLSWTVTLRTDRPKAVSDVFAFTRDMIKVTVQPASPAPQTSAPARPAPAAPTAEANPPDAAAPTGDPLDPELPRPPGMSVLAENGSMIRDFCGEADDHLEAADRHLLTLHADPTSDEALNAVYRVFHTIKGVASMLRLGAVQMVAHEAESLLNLARDGKVVLRGKPLDLVFASLDALKRQFTAIRHWRTAGGQLEQDAALPRLLADLRSAVRSAAPAATEPAPAPAPLAAASAVEPAPQPVARADSPAPAAASQPKDAAPAVPNRRSSPDKETVRVDRDKLDKLINTIGELVIAQSMVQEELDGMTRHTGRHSLALPELSKISRDLQELSLALRMVPLQGTFQKMARLVRDLSRKLDKPIELDLHGEETELDKTVVDQLGDPLMHMVRNAVDHGLEPPAARVAAGKSAEGHVSLLAYHQGGNVYIELSDDGRGLDRDRILRKAVEKGLVADGQRLSDSEVYALIFAPGFSTAAAVTDVSGRGVGMDVVRRNVEALQGHILIRTVPGQGTTFTIRLPLTLAIMDGLMVGLGGDVYVLPLLSVVESFRPRPAEVHRVAGRGEAVTVRGEVVPLLRLYHLLGRPGDVTDPCRGLVVLVEDQGVKHALLVDELLGQMQAVVKSLDANYRRVEGLAGATILGDGRVAMILDIHGLTQLHARVGRPAHRPDPVLAASPDSCTGDDP